MNGMYGIHHSTILRSSYNQKAQNQYLNYLTDPRFQGKKIFLRYCLRITKNTRHTGYFPLTVETTCYSVMTDGKNFICQPVKNITTYQNIRKITLIKEMIIKYDVLNYLSFYYLNGPRQSTLQRTLR